MALRTFAGMLAAPVVLGVALLGGILPPAPPQANPPRAITPIFTKTKTAENPTDLVLLVDERKVVGWVSGARDRRGQTVGVTANGRTETIPLDARNSFEWPYKADKETPARFQFGDAVQTLTLRADAQKRPPSVFFVVDRSVYRPEQKLQFAGFLRERDGEGQLVPLANRKVEVEITAQRKNTTAAKLALVSDERGRIAGAYAFTPADVLDDYRLHIAGYEGAATVALAEYRKSKIRLKIAGKPEAEKLRLTFAALDFLDKPVPDARVQFIAQVVEKNERAKRHTLRAEEFVYREKDDDGLIDPEALTDEELLLSEGESAYLPIAGRYGGQSVVAEVSGDLHLGGSGSAEHAMDLKPEWRDDRHTVIVQGVLIDANGREQRATESIALGENGAGDLRLTLAKRYFEPGETVNATVRVVGAARFASGTLIAQRLSPGAITLAGYGYEAQLPFSSLSVARWRPVPPPAAVQRTLAAATPFQGERAELRLDEPGAYTLVAMVRLPDGRTLRAEAGCVVRAAEEMPALVLRLDKDEFAAGEELTGELHSRFAGARVLLTIRDSAGVRLWQPLQMTGSTLALRQKLPGSLGYGCTVEVQYVEAPGRAADIASRFVRVLPTDRMLSVRATTRPEYRPGDTARIDIAVNRNEPVDLVVSVYDQALLGVAADRLADIRSFYLADENGRAAADRDRLRRRLGGISVATLVERARALLKEGNWDDENPGATRELAPLRELVSVHDAGGPLYAGHVATLLRLAGVQTQIVNAYGGWNHRIDKETATTLTLFDLVANLPAGDWRLQPAFWNDTLVLAENHPGYPARAFFVNGMAMNQWAFNGGFGGGGFGGQGRWLMARGDASGRGFASANGSLSFAEGQAVYSYQPAGATAPQPILVAEAERLGELVRRDFSDSAFWSARLRTDARGRASVAFKLPDSLTNWRVVVTAISPSLHVGQETASFRTFKPIMVWPMLPRAFTEGDKVKIFAAVHNQTDRAQTIRTTASVENGRLHGDAAQTVLVPARGNTPVYWTFTAGRPGFTEILMSAEAGGAGADASLKRLPVVDAAVTEVKTASGFTKEAAKITVPKGIDLGTATLEIGIVPSLVADLVDTLDYLVEYPYGCVEQTMSRFLPAIKVAQTLKRAHIEHAGLREKLPGCVAAGVKRLLELQQPDGGWGWQGGSQTHEMMTPYALYGLLEAERAGYDIGSPDAIERGLNRLKGFITAMNESQTADRVYCLYVYSHRRPIEPAWWDFLRKQLDNGKLSDYALALALEMAVADGKKDLAAGLARALRAAAVKSGGDVCWKTAGFSRWGDDPNEITAAALKSLVAFDPGDPLIPGVLSYFAENKRGNRWNSTKDTAMIVYALCDYLARQREDPRGAPKQITVTLNDGAPARVSLSGGGLIEKRTIPGGELRPGVNVVRFDGGGAGTMYRLVLRYKQAGREIPAQNSGIAVTRRFFLLDAKGKREREVQSGDTVPRGAYLLSEVEARFGDGTVPRYVLVENPKPSTCEIQPAEDPRFRQASASSPHALREDRLAAVIFHHEQTLAEMADRCVLHAELSGDYRVPAAQVEMMYRSEVRGHSGTFHFTVAEEAPGQVARRP